MKKLWIKLPKKGILEEMITIEQIRAGRALLDWTQSDLARASGLSVRALNMIERGSVIPRTETLVAIQATLQAEQIVFSADHGVRLLRDRIDVERHVGPATKEILNHDIITQLRWRGGICRYMGPNEASFADMNKDVLENFYRDCWRYNITDLVLVQKGFTTFVSRPKNYRWLAPEFLGKLAFCVYHDTVALLTGKDNDHLVFIRDRIIAEHFQAQFESLWNNAQILPFLKYLKDTETEQWTVARAIDARARVKKMGY